MSKLSVALRLLLGLIVVLFGLNKFLHFIPLPEMAAPAEAFMADLQNSGYLMELVALVEIGTGLLLLVNRYTLLALVMLFPVMLNAFLFHVMLDLQTIPAAAFCFGCNVVLLYRRKPAWRGLVQP